MAIIDNLVMYLSLEEASGNAIDAHGNNDLTDTNSVGTAAGKVSNARDFERDSSMYFRIEDNTDISTGDIDFSFAFWVQLESKSAFNSVFGKWDGAPNSEYIFYYEDSADRLIFSVSNDGTAGVGATANNFGSVSTGAWMFVVVWHDAANDQIGIQVNNGTADTTAHSTGVLDSTSGLEVGAFGGGQSSWDGLIDEFGFWKKVLTSDEKTWLYNSGNGRSYANIVAGMTDTSAGFSINMNNLRPNAFAPGFAR